MDTSILEHTPLRSNDLRRRTLLQQTEMASPLRRTSFMNTSAALLEKPNDDSERLNRRNHVDMQRRLSNLPQAQSPLNESTKFIGEQEMKDHFQICTKLFTENKITTKNAWQLHIIDLLRHMSQKSSKDTLQFASTSLDISAKVYGIRVDDIHSDGLKLASSMARSSEKQTPQNTDGNEYDGDDGNAENDQNIAKKKKKKKRLSVGEKNTVSKDPKSLIAPLPKLESVFFSTRTNAETNAIDNLLTNTLKMDNSGYKFMLLSKKKAWPEGPDPLIDSKQSTKKYSVTINSLNNFKICFPFNDFHVDEWDPDEEEKQLEAEKSLISQRENEIVYDDNGIPIPELDGSITDIFSNDAPADNDMLMDIDDDVHEEQEFCAKIQGEIARIVDFKPDDMSHRTEYSYNTLVSTHSGKVIDQIWAGPSHWKLKYIRRSTAKYSGQQIVQSNEKVVAAKQIKKKQKPLIVDFNENEEFVMSMTQDLKVKKKRRFIEAQKITLPVPDSSCIKLIEHVNELMLKRGAAPLKKLPSSEDSKAQDEYEISAYKYENPNDSQYCSQQNNDDDIQDNDDMMDDMLDHEELMGVEAQQNFVGDNLVELPESVPKSYVPYALRAKKMDMKKLKAAVWQNLTNEQEISQKDSTRKGNVIPSAFSKLYKEIPKYLSDKMREELSCPLVFVALLHLCNEQNLELKQDNDYKDFFITGPQMQNKTPYAR